MVEMFGFFLALFGTMAAQSRLQRQGFGDTEAVIFGTITPILITGAIVFIMSEPPYHDLSGPIFILGLPLMLGLSYLLARSVNKMVADEDPQD